MASLALAKGATSESVNTDWTRSAGDFSCKICRRKRLSAMYFSKAQVKRAIESSDMFAICKECVAKIQAEEQEKSRQNVSKGDSETLLRCSICEQEKAAAMYSKSQANNIRHGRNGKCKACVNKLEEDEMNKNETSKQAKHTTMRENARGKKGVAGRLALACAESAMEGEAITGLKAVRIGSGRGRGRGSWRARSRGGRTGSRR